MALYDLSCSSCKKLHFDVELNFESFLEEEKYISGLSCVECGKVGTLRRRFWGQVVIPPEGYKNTIYSSGVSKETGERIS
jgi:hypothetical protein